MSPEKRKLYNQMNNNQEKSPFEDFDKNFARIQKGALGFAIFSAVMSILVIGGLGWAIYKLVTHFCQ
jgi:hypothetical protein